MPQSKHQAPPKAASSEQTHNKLQDFDYDYCIVGSGFGGSVSALRLAEKGYKVLVIEKGKRYTAKDFPKTNWNLKKWFWMPLLNWRGFFKMTFFRHLTVFSGVGVGGGSLVYANTLPIPKESFFQSTSWSHLGNWKEELRPHYDTARFMLGAQLNSHTTYTDQVMQELAKDLNLEENISPVHVGVYMGEPGKTVADPYFGGKGPERAGCTFCGNCMVGCRHNAKNTLDRNYLYFAEKLGVEIKADTEVTSVEPLENLENEEIQNNKENLGYLIHMKQYQSLFRNKKDQVRCKNIIFSGGVLGSVSLLLKLKEGIKTLPDLSPQLGNFIRTNNEAIIGVIAPKSQHNFSKGIAISSILHCDEHSHLEPVRYGQGSGFFRILLAPHAPGSHMLKRLAGGFLAFLKQPKLWFRTLITSDFATKSQILLYMRSLEGSLSFRRRRSIFTGLRLGMTSEVAPGMKKPSAFIAEASDLASRFAKKVGGVTASLLTETFFNIPSTAHVLGGCCMGKDANEGVIDAQHRVFGYKGMYVIDGSAVSANPGVNPSLTITAMAERAMSFIPAKATLETIPLEEFLGTGKKIETAGTPLQAGKSSMINKQ